MMRSIYDDAGVAGIGADSELRRAVLLHNVGARDAAGQLLLPPKHPEPRLGRLVPHGLFRCACSMRARSVVSHRARSGYAYA